MAPVTLNIAILGNLAQSSLLRETGTSVAASLLSVSRGSAAAFNPLALLKTANTPPALPGVSQSGVEGLVDFINKSVPNNTQLLKDLSTVITLGTVSADSYFPQFDSAKAAYLYNQNSSAGDAFALGEGMINALL